MPILEFKCKKKSCSHVFEDIQFKSTDEDPEECPKCKGKKLEKIDISMSTPHFKGPGWSGDGYSSTGWAKKDSNMFRVGNPKF